MFLYGRVEVDRLDVFGDDSLLTRWRELVTWYDDFDTVLELCDHDLDQAIADSEARLDYTVFERARDFAGAARWNLFPGKGVADGPAG